MIYWLLFITIVFLTIVQYCFFSSLVRREKITKFLSLPKHSNLPRLIFGVSIIIFFVILFILMKKLSTTQPILNKAPLSSPKLTKLPSDIQELGHVIYTSQESYYYLYTSQNKSKEVVETIAQQLKTNFCMKVCTINLYDSPKAYALDQERLVITDDQTMQIWNKKNYLYVADHYIGYLPYIPYTSFSYYPYKDLYYQQLISK